MPEYIRLITSVCAHMEERQSVCERQLFTVYVLYNSVNNLPHTHGLLIEKSCTKLQRIDLFGINL